MLGAWALAIVLAQAPCACVSPDLEPPGGGRTSLPNVPGAPQPGGTANAGSGAVPPSKPDTTGQSPTQDSDTGNEAPAQPTTPGAAAAGSSAEAAEEDAGLPP